MNKIKYSMYYYEQIQYKSILQRLKQNNKDQKQSIRDLQGLK